MVLFANSHLLVFMFYDSLNRNGTATEVDHISIKLKVWIMNTSINKPVFIITRIIHQAASCKLLDKVSERYKPVSFIKARVCYWIHEDLHKEILRFYRVKNIKHT